VTRADDADRFLRSETERGRFRGAVLLADRGELVLRAAYGQANEDWQVANTPTTKFRIGSVTKQLTAAAVLRLVAAGALDLERGIATWLDGLPPAWAQLTPHQLLSHTAGLADSTDEARQRALAATGATPRTLIGIIADAPLASSPGTSWRYSNTGFVLLGMLIEQASGRPYAAYLEDELLRPLGMTSSGYDAPLAIVRERASGYAVRDGRLENAHHIHMSVPYAAGGLYSTVDDLLRWHTALHGGEVIDAALYQRMIEAHAETWIANEFHGYGMFVSRRSGRLCLFHGGSVNGFVSSAHYYPEQQASLIVLCNLRDVAIQSVVDRLSALLARDADDE
jgi:CubicO group peptidase (beta-lactamase class C family)